MKFAQARSWNSSNGGGEGGLVYKLVQEPAHTADVASRERRRKIHPCGAYCRKVNLRSSCAVEAPVVEMSTDGRISPTVARAAWKGWLRKPSKSAL